jgi:hypothetical protein
MRRTDSTRPSESTRDGEPTRPTESNERGNRPTRVTPFDRQDRAAYRRTLTMSHAGQLMTVTNDRTIEIVLGEAEPNAGILRMILEAEGFHIVGHASNDEELHRVLTCVGPT